MFLVEITCTKRMIVLVCPFEIKATLLETKSNLSLSKEHNDYRYDYRQQTVSA